jgi:hypothetical protein
MAGPACDSHPMPKPQLSEPYVAVGPHHEADVLVPNSTPLGHHVTTILIVARSLWRPRIGRSARHPETVGDTVDAWISQS